MPSAFGNLAAQIVDLRARIGQGTSTEIVSDAELTTCLSAALNEFNRMASAYQLVSFSTVAGQQTYTEAQVSFPATAYRPIRHIFWGASGQVDPAETGLLGSCGCLAYAQNLNDGFGTETFDPVSIEIVARNIELVQRALGGRGKHTKDNKVWLDPVPGAVQTVYYLARVPYFAAAADVDIQHYETYSAYAEHKAYQLLAGKQSEVVGVSAGFGKSIRTAGGAVYLRLAQEAKNAFYAGVRKATRLYRS